VAFSNRGTGFTLANLTTSPLTLSGGGGSGATASIAALQTVAGSFTLANGGTGYAVGQDISITGGGATQTVLYRVQSVDANGTILTVNHQRTGIGYTSSSGLTYVPTSGSGTGATFTFNDNFAVNSINMTAAGTGYTSAPTFTSSSGASFAGMATISSLSLTGTNNQLGGDGNLTVNTAIGQTASGAGFSKIGGGTLTVSATNTYTGATTVNGGILNVTGSTAAASAVAVGGTLASGTPKLTGSGTINGAVTVKSAGGGVVGRLDAGDASASNPAGKLTVNNNLTFESGSIFEWDIKDGATMTESAGDRGVHYDAVDITGGGALSVTASVFRVVLNAGGFNTGNFWDSNRSWASSSIFNTGGSLAGFTTLEWYEGSTLKGQSSNLAGRSTDGFFTISGSTLTWTAVPEPTSALAGLLITAGLLRRRRK
jgi:autotransporter-associated beta strand protein